MLMTWSMLLVRRSLHQLLPYKKPHLDSVAKELHEVFSLTFQIPFHLNPGIQSFKIVTQIECLLGPNGQSSAYRSALANLYLE